MSVCFQINSTTHRRAQATTTCPTCGAAPGKRCTGVETVTGGHYARAHLFLVDGKPPPDDQAIAELTRVDGIRADARPFIAWLSGEYEFRNCGASGRGLSMRVHRTGEEIGHFNVRTALVDMAARHGLVVSAGTTGRTRYVLTDRGREFYHQHNPGGSDGTGS